MKSTPPPSQSHNSLQQIWPTKPTKEIKNVVNTDHLNILQPKTVWRILFYDKNYIITL